MDNITFEWDKEEKSRIISLEDLEASTSLQDFDGKYSKKSPLKHTDLIKKLADVLTVNHKVDVAEIHVSKNRSKFINILDPKNENLMKARIFENVIVRLNISSLSNDEMNMMYAIHYSPNGITVAQGTNITVCSNMTIMNHNNMVSTAGRSGLTYDELMMIISGWAGKMDKTYETYGVLIEQMKGISLTIGEVHEMIGDLHIMAAEQAYKSGEAPLTLNELSRFSQLLLDEEKYINNDPITLWELFNIATNLLTHSDTNLDNRLPMLNKIGDYMIERYTSDGGVAFNYLLD